MAIKWKQFKLVDLIDVSNNKVTSFDGEKEYIATGDIHEDRIASHQSVTFFNKPSRADLIFTEKDLLFAKMKATTKVLSGKKEFEDKIFSTGFYIFSPKENVSKSYLYFFLISNGFNLQKDSYCKGVTMSALSNEGLRKIKINIPINKDEEPDYEEQEKIASLLEEAEDLKNKRAEANQKMEDLIPALFVKMFGDPVTNTMDFDQILLSELGRLDRGKSQHRPRTAPELFGGKHPFVQTGDVSNAGWRLSEYNQTYSDIGLDQSKLWPKETLCITIAANIAKTTILNFAGCFPDSVVGFTANKERSNVDYVQGLFIFLQKGLEAMAPQAAQQNINLQILRSIKVPNPPLELQNKFADLVKEIEIQKDKQKQSTQMVDELFNAVMAKSFAE
ncbi:MAG: restriction endonuclease subunit S [bacterium]|nr:restriction endonuclease subunit S [bacterium]